MNYVCDLKSLKSGGGVSYEFLKYVMLDHILNFKFCSKFFGIVMEPNNQMNYISRKYFLTKYSTLFLYQITYKKYLEHVNLIKKIFADHFFVEGYKKFKLESNGEFMKVCHIAQSLDLKYIKLQPSVIINDHATEIMFCLEENDDYILKLEKVNIKYNSKMSVIGFGCEGEKWKFVKTYMI